MAAARRFFRSAVSVTGKIPCRVTSDGHDSYPRAIQEVLGNKAEHRCSAYLNRRIEQDHRGIKQAVLSDAGLWCLFGAALLPRFRTDAAILSSAPIEES